MLINIISMHQLQEIFKALSDETRFRILKLLGEREVCVCEMMQVLEMPQSTISRHMNILKRAGLVMGRREGKWVHYSLQPAAFNPYAGSVLELIKGLLEDNDTVRKDKEALKKAVRVCSVPRISSPSQNSSGLR
ncbi:MAG: metalloregulator ArsR/SmtB family transcription factor [Deltaproteobacteria bacterium]|nr:metalloregulator ArsR/SmtB family transcription factor [Deltaproteobacteria bacterium]